MKRFLKLMRNGRHIPAKALCVLVCVIMIAASLPIALYQAVEIPDNIASSDDFNRGDSADVGNGWEEIPDGSYAAIKSNGLEITASNDSTWTSAQGADGKYYYSNIPADRVQRPMEEKSVNQTVSLKMSGTSLKEKVYPVIWLRVQNNDTTAAPKGYAMYYDGVFIYVIRSTSTERRLIWKWNWSYYGGVQLSVISNVTFSFSATSDGNGGTELSVSAVINRTDGKTAEYTDLFRFTDTTAELQSAGTAAIQAFEMNTELDGQKTIVDDFNFTYTDISFKNVVADDSFDRTELGDGWEVKPDSMYASVSDNKLSFKVPAGYASHGTRRIQRTMSEAAVNQTVSVTFSATQIREVKFPVLWLRVQESSTDTQPIGYYCYFDNTRFQICKSTSEGKNVQLSVNSGPGGTNWYTPNLTMYDRFTLEFSAIGDGFGKTDLTVKITGYLNNGNVNPKTYTISDTTAELQTAGTVAISGWESNSSENDLELLLDDFKYTVITDATALFELMQSGDKIVKSGVGYTQESFDLISEKIRDGEKVLAKGNKMTQDEINAAAIALKSAIDNAVKLPGISELKINGNVISQSAYNTYYATVGEDVDSLSFEITPEKAEDTFTVTRDSTQVEGTTQEFTADFSESYTVTLVFSAESYAKSNFKITVYRENGDFDQFTDDFETCGGIPGNGWIEETEGILSAYDGKLRISCGGVTGNDNKYTHRIIRPYNEKAQDQMLVVDIPVEDFINGCTPVFWLRLQEDGDNDPLNNEGYYVLANLADGLYIYKRTNVNGVMTDTKLYYNQFRPSLKAYEGSFRFEIVVSGTDTTQIRVRLKGYAPSEGIEFWRRQVGFEDTQNPITSAGTVGVSYTGSEKDMSLGYFEYSEYSAGDMMIHATLNRTPSNYQDSGKLKGYFGQWLELDPNETYVYSYKIYCVTDAAKSGVQPMLQYSSPSTNSTEFFFFNDQSRDYENKSFTGTFTVPADALIGLDGKVAVKVGFTTGYKGSEAYIYGMTVYKQSDSSKTNLFKNSDFSDGLYGWNTTTSGSFTPIGSKYEYASYYMDIDIVPCIAEYFEADADLKEEKQYASHKGDYMLFTNGTGNWADFCQSVDLIPGETYYFTYYYNFILNDWIQPMFRYYPADTGVYSNLTPSFKTTDPANSLITVEFTVPTNTTLNPDGTTDINVGINMGRLGSIAYFYKPTLYLKSDTSKTNLLYNSDFRNGFAGWWCMSSDGYPHTLSNVLISSELGDLEIVPVELSYFGLGDLSGDGEWWREFYPDGLPTLATTQKDDKSDESDEDDDFDFILDFDEDETDEETEQTGNSTEVSEQKDTNKKTSSVKKNNTTEDESFNWLPIVIGIIATVLVIVALALILIILKKRKRS